MIAIMIFFKNKFINKLWILKVNPKKWIFKSRCLCKFHENQKQVNNLNFFGECCWKHICLPFPTRRHVVFFHDAANLGLKSHIQHPVCFIQDQESTVSEEKIGDILRHNQKSTPNNEHTKVTLYTYQNLF